MVARGDALASVLEALCRIVEKNASGSLCSILLVDSNGTQLRHAAAPGLPRNYIQWIDGRAIALAKGPCALAALRKEPVIAIDFESDSRWPEEYRALALSHGLRACWSTPILSQAGAVLGTFALYCRESGSPTPKQQNLIDQFTHLASIAIERTQAEEKIRHDERELRQIVEAIPELIVVLTPDGRPLYANKLILEYTGLTVEEIQAGALSERAIHREDLERLRGDINRALPNGTPFEMEYRVLRQDGQYRWFLNRFNPLRDEDGRVIRWYATGTDIDDRKQAEERVQKENLALREEIDKTSMFEEIIGASPALQTVLSHVAKVAPMETQLALLRILQEREFERVGGSQSLRADVRVIAATHRDLQAAIVAGAFRSDLFYRLNVFPIDVPPLRQRKEDIIMLVEYFIDRYARKAGKKIKGINKKTLALLQSYPWPATSAGCRTSSNAPSFFVRRRISRWMKAGSLGRLFRHRR
jgi:PAS domain S-box-containing protein